MKCVFKVKNWKNARYVKVLRLDAERGTVRIQFKNGGLRTYKIEEIQKIAYQA